ncbi:MAG: hypothetical protein BWK79_17455, partial [Beggiatoa sp. IS2]
GGTDAPNNLVTLCEKHHTLVHKDKLKLKVVQFKSLKSATIMNIVNNPLCHKLPTAQTTFGYMTKVMRTQLGLAKSHANDAFVIASGNDQQRLPPLKLLFKRKNNRSLQKRPLKGNKRSLRTQRYPIQPNDIIEYDGKIYRSKGTHCKGSRVTAFVGDKIVSLSTKKVKCLFHQKSLFVIYGQV